MPDDEWWCYCGLAFWTAKALGEHQRNDHTADVENRRTS